jgi:flagellar biosynthesis protein FliR
MVSKSRRPVAALAGNFTRLLWHDMSLRGRTFKVLFLATILGMFLSGFCFGSCLELIAWARIAGYFDAPVGYKHTPLVGASAKGASALFPSFLALVMFWLFLWLLLQFFDRDQRKKKTHER